MRYFYTACMKRLPALMHSKELGSGSIALATGVMSGDRSESVRRNGAIFLVLG